MPHVNYEYIDFPVGLIEGQRASTRQKATRSGTNTSGITIPYGLAVIAPAGTSGIIALPSAAGQFFVGITFFETIAEQAEGVSPGIPDKREGDYMTEGDIAVICETAVTNLSDPVFFRHTAGSETVIGRFRTDADTATCDEIPATNARWLKLSAAGELNVLHISVS